MGRITHHGEISAFCLFKQIQFTHIYTHLNFKNGYQKRWYGTFNSFQMWRFWISMFKFRAVYVCLFWDFEVEMLLLLRHKSYAGHCRLIHEAPPKCCPRNAPNASSNLITTHYMHSKDQNMMYIWFCVYVISLSLWSISSASEPVWRPLVDQAQLPCDLETTGILLCQSTKRNVDPTTRPHPRKDSWSSNYHMVRSMSLWSMFLVSYTFSTQDSCHFVDSLGKGFT